MRDATDEGAPYVRTRNIVVASLALLLGVHTERSIRRHSSPRATPEPCGVYERWRAGVDRYDYIQSLDLSPRTTGEFVFGHDQVIRIMLTFGQRRVDERTLELSNFVSRDPFTGDEERLDWGPMRVRHVVEEGDFRFVEGEPYAPVERHYRCRFRWTANFDHDVTDYYGVLLSERPLMAANAAAPRNVRSAESTPAP